MALPSVAYPGLLLGPSSQFTSGAGTHLYASSIYASIAGRPSVTSSSTNAASASAPASTSTKHSSNSTNNIPTTKPPSTSILPALSVLPDPPPFSIPSPAVSSKNTLPAVGSVVLCRVTRLTARQANVAILVVGEEEQNGVCADEWAGVVRREDIRGMERDKVKVQESFKVGDLLRGEVISLGDQSNYYLTTAKNELGVIMAKSEAGNTMFPISWKEFRDPITGLTESRKVAKPL